MNRNADDSADANRVANDRTGGNAAAKDHPQAGQRAEQQLDARGDVPEHVADSIQTVAELRAKMEREVAPHQLGIEWFTKRLARPGVVFGSLAFVIVWIGVNAAVQASGHRTFDPFPFSALQGLLSLAAFSMTILILTTTTRLGDVAEQRARLALQIGLLTEQKVAKSIALLNSLRQDDPHLDERVDPVAEAMAEPVNPASVNEALDQSHEAILGS